MTSLKKHSFGEPKHETKNIAVLGAGLMGAGIAQISAEKGYRVLLKDKEDEVSCGNTIIRFKSTRRLHLTQF